MSDDTDALAPDRVWLTRGQLADRWQIPLNTVRDWAVDGKGPRFARFGRHVRYRLADVIAWEDEQFGDTGVSI